MTRHNIIRIFASVVAILTLLISCGAGKKTVSAEENENSLPENGTTTLFSPDSAYSYVESQVNFGPRVPGTQAHKACGEWLSEKLKSFGAEVTEQNATLTTFDGTRIPMRNIFARINPEAEKQPFTGRLLAKYLAPIAQLSSLLSSPQSSASQSRISTPAFAPVFGSTLASSRSTPVPLAPSLAPSTGVACFDSSGSLSAQEAHRTPHL